MSDCECKPDRALPSIKLRVMQLRCFGAFHLAFHKYNRFLRLGDSRETVGTDAEKNVANGYVVICASGNQICSNSEQSEHGDVAEDASRSQQNREANNDFNHAHGVHEC